MSGSNGWDCCDELPGALALVAVCRAWRTGWIGLSLAQIECSIWRAVRCVVQKRKQSVVRRRMFMRDLAACFRFRSPPRTPHSRTDQERPPLALLLLSHPDPGQPNRPDAPAGDPRASGAEAVNVAGKAPNVREWPEAATVLVPMRCATAVPWPIEHRHSDSALLHMRVDEGIVLVNGNTNSTSTGIRSSILRASSARQAP